MLTKYQFEFDIIPQLIDSVAQDPESIGNIADIHFFEIVIAKQGGATFSIPDFEIDKAVLEKGRSAAIVYTFPKPDQEPEALFGAIAMTFCDGRLSMRYFTLEMGSGTDEYFVCETAKDAHKSYGRLQSPVNKEDFINYISQILKVQMPANG